MSSLSIRPRRSPAAVALAAAALALGAVAASSTIIQLQRVRRALRAAGGGAAPSRADVPADVAGDAQAEVAHPAARPSMRLLLVGDSAALGVGADGPRHALAGLFAAEFPGAQVLNLAQSGAMLADVRAQVQAAGPGKGFDVAVMVAGGNDILRRRSMPQLAADAQALTAELARKAPTVVWLGVANMGLAPLFVPPWSWWISARVRRARGLFREAAHRHGASYVDFFREARDDVFSRDPLRYFAADGIHPSSSTYRHCFDVLRNELRASGHPARGRAGAAAQGVSCPSA
jgi:lysophospholipase L1-like esterase